VTNKHTTVDSRDGGITVLNHCLSWSKFVNTHLYHSRQWFNIHVHYRRAAPWPKGERVFGWTDCMEYITEPLVLSISSISPAMSRAVSSQLKVVTQ